MTKERPLPPISAERLTARAAGIRAAYAGVPVTRPTLHADTLGTMRGITPRERERTIMRVMELEEPRSGEPEKERKNMPATGVAVQQRTLPAGGEGDASPGARGEPPAVPERAEVVDCSRMEAGLADMA